MQRQSLIASSSFKPRPPTTYDVFLSFRGEDTRNNFTSHLHAALCQKGIYTFLDDRRLERGKEISPVLLKAIEESRCTVVVMSINYASSRWCLDELVKIIECKDELGQIVLPIFYHVDPSHVRKQIGPFQEIFEKHEQVFKRSKQVLDRWRNALTQVANLAGWHLEMNRDEGTFIQNFVAHISMKVIVAPFKIPKDLFGIEPRLEKLNSMVGTGLPGVRIIGICGLGGIGKTTLARFYYKWRCSQFDGTTFLSNVREVCKTHGERGITALQQQLLRDILKEEQSLIGNVYDGSDILKARLCRKRVLVVIDDVDELEQVENLAGEIDCVGSGSRIIITTRDESLLIRHGVNSIYKVELFDNEIALQHFCWHAFKNVEPLRGYRVLSKKLVEYAGGLPLALRVLGSFLYRKNVEQWKSALNRLKIRPKKEIVDVLRISYDGLEETEKKLFLYVACFFNEEYMDAVKRALNGFGVYPEIGIAVLVEKSLLRTEGSRRQILMHDLLRDMGRDIVREKYALNSPEIRTWLWSPDDIEFVLKNSKHLGKLSAVEAMVYTFTGESNVMKICDAISKMKKMRLLFINFPDISENNNNNQLINIKALSNELLYMDWYRYPFPRLPSNFQPDSLVELHLPNSKVQQLWDRGTKPLKNLRIINLCDCAELKRMRHFEVVPNVRKLFLKGCKNLSEIGVSISHLKKLTLLDLEDCKSLENFPTNKLKLLRSLQRVNLRGCSLILISKLPEDLVHLKYLKGINVSVHHKKNVPPSLKALIRNFDTVRPICYRRDNEGGSVLAALVFGAMFAFPLFPLMLCTIC